MDYLRGNDEDENKSSGSETSTKNVELITDVKLFQKSSDPSFQSMKQKNENKKVEAKLKREKFLKYGDIAGFIYHQIFFSN